jgi:hypothetical protein
MQKIIHIKFLLTFILGIFVGITFCSNLKAQNIDSTSSSATHLRMAPSTSEERLHVNVTARNKNMKYLKIFDIIGNEVASIDLSGKTGSIAFSLDLSQFENGLYLCNLYSEKGIIETKKIYWSR